jgi:adenylate cyclase
MSLARSPSDRRRLRALRRRGLRGALIGLAAGLVAIAVARVPLVETYERRTVDLRLRALADQRRADPSIVAVVIDQKSLDAVAAPRERGGLEQGWPWPRDFHAAVLHYLLSSGARAVAFDLVFSETSIYTKLGVADDDRELGAAAEGRPVVQPVVLTAEAPAAADRAWPPGLRERGWSRPPRARAVDVFNKATLPVPAIVQTAAGLGWIGFEPDDDGTCRSIRPAAPYGPQESPDVVEVPSLPLAVATLIGARVERGQDTWRVNGVPVPLDEEGRMLLRFHGGEHAYRQYSYAKVLESAKRVAAGQSVSAARPEEFRGKIVIVGASAAGLLDFRATSIGAILPGYLIHAAALDNLLHGDALRRPPGRVRAGVLLFLALVAGTLTALGGRLGPGVLVTLGLATFYAAGAVWVFDARGVWMDVVPPALALTLAWGGATGYAYLTEGRERRFLRSAFSRYVAPEVVEALVAEPGRLALGGETREVTVMFADVAGFTSLSEGRAPQEIVSLMNECFTELTRVIQTRGGTVDKFIGDAVMAFWNAPVEQADHAARACAAGRELLEAVETLNVVWRERGLPTIAMRVGIATGPAVVGNIGSSTKFNYTVMGDTVNLASRLEGAAKVYDTSSLIAGSTVEAAAGGSGFRELDRLQVKGRVTSVPVFELLPATGVDGRAEADALFAAGLQAYRARRFTEAARQFEAVIAKAGKDGPAREMLERCRHFLVEPPGPDWQGDYALSTK